MKAEIEADNSISYSAIVLLEETDDGLAPLVKTLNEVFTSRGACFEIIIVANGTGEFLRKELGNLQCSKNVVKAVELSGKASPASYLKAGFEESRGEIIVLCGSHQQITKESLIHLIDSLDESSDIINSWRQERLDSSFNQFQSRVFNSLVRRITKSGLHDLSAAIKIFRRQVLDETELYGNMHRFLPIVAERKGFKTKEVGCTHYQWRGRTGPCGFSEYVERISDIVTLYFITRFASKPLRFFSLVGAAFLAVGLSISCWVFMGKLFLGYPIGDRPILLVSVFLMVVGVQVGSMGLLGEIIAFTHGRHKPHYTIEKSI